MDAEAVTVAFPIPIDHSEHQHQPVTVAYASGEGGLSISFDGRWEALAGYLAVAVHEPEEWIALPIIAHGAKRTMRVKGWRLAEIDTVVEGEEACLIPEPSPSPASAFTT